jgi:hypothetical protein
MSGTRIISDAALSWQKSSRYMTSFFLQQLATVVEITIQLVFTIASIFLFLPVLAGAIIMNWSHQVFNRILPYVGASILGLFALSVTIPFHFQGFVNLLSKCEWFENDLSCPHAPYGDPTGDGIGLSRLPGLDVLSYAWTVGFGLPTLTLAAIAVFCGKFTERRPIDMILKSGLLAFAVFSASRLYKYGVIADWTD